jgi:hypothetical protein
MTDMVVTQYLLPLYGKFAKIIENNCGKSFSVNILHPTLQCSL